MIKKIRVKVDIKIKLNQILWYKIEKKNQKNNLKKIYDNQKIEYQIWYNQ